MASQPSSNNPAGEPPSANDAAPPAIDQEIFETLGLSSTPADADAIANSQPAVASPPDGEGDGSTAQPSPEPTPQAATPPSPAAPEPAPAQPSAEPPAPSATPATPPAASLAVDEDALRTASLEAQVNALSAEIAALRASPQQPSADQPPAATPGQPAAEQPFRYALTLPEPTRAALLSDDPQQNLGAINAIVNDLGTIVHNTVVSQLRTEFSGAIYNMLREASNVEQGAVRQTAADGARQDYYKAFPAHNNPLVLPLIQAESQKMAAEFPHLSWNPQYINALGARVNAAMESLSAARSGVQPEPQPQAAPGNQPPARPAAMLPSGNREPSAVTPSGNLSEDIVDVLNPF